MGEMMILSVTTTADNLAYVSVRHVPADMTDRDVLASVEQGAANGCERCRLALSLVCCWYNMADKTMPSGTRVYRDGAYE